MKWLGGRPVFCKKMKMINPDPIRMMGFGLFFMGLVVFTLLESPFR